MKMALLMMMIMIKDDSNCYDSDGLDGDDNGYCSVDDDGKVGVI